MQSAGAPTATCEGACAPQAMKFRALGEMWEQEAIRTFELAHGAGVLAREYFDFQTPKTHS